MAVRDLTREPPFGRLTVLQRAGSRHGKALWRCRCSCGNEVVVLGTYLTTGDTRSCGCLFRETTVAKGRRRRVDLTDAPPFGRLTILYEHGQAKTTKGECLWVCRCACGNLLLVSGTRLRKGRCLSCGCLRDELARARAAAVGSAKRIKACRSCGRIYEATGPQKECSDACRRRFHARDEARRRREQADLEAVREWTALNTELERRLASHGQDNRDGATGAP